MAVGDTLIEVAVVVLDGVRAVAVHRHDGAGEPLPRALPVATDARLDVEAHDGEVHARRAGSAPGAASVDLPVVRFNVKSRVSGNWQGAGQWFPGSVVTVNGDGTYAIQYDDGDFDESVPDGHLVAAM